MADIIRIQLSEASIGSAIKLIERYKKDIDRKIEVICKRLADMGAERIQRRYASALYDGNKDIAVSVERTQKGYVFRASGESVLFVEFGAGARMGYGHPEAGGFGYGPGTYPSDKGHWDDPKGWWIPQDAGGGHTYGNPPSMVMYRTEQELEQAILAVAREVFEFD